MLHSIVLSIAALSAAFTAHGLVVGRDGQGIGRASVVFRDASGAIAQTTTDANGRFTVTLPHAASDWEISAKGYQSERLQISNLLKLIAVLNPNEPGFSTTVAADDLGILPYQDVGYALSLSPFQVLIGGSQVGVGDRGLGGSANADFDNGTSVSAPAHYLSFVGLNHASSSYGFSHSAAGRVTLGFDNPNAALGTIGGGSLQLEGVQARAGDAYAAFGTSSGDETTQTRYDFIARTHVGRAKVLFVADAGSFLDGTSLPATPSRDGAAQLRVELPIRHSVARFQIAAQAKSKDPVDDYSQRRTSASAKVLVRHVGDTMTSEYGFEQDLYTGDRDYVDKTKYYSGSVRDNRIYTTQALTFGNFSTTATLSSYALASQGSTQKTPQNAQRATATAFGLSAQWNVDQHLQFQLGHEDNEDTPDASFYFGNPIPTLVVDLSHTNQSTLSYRRQSGFVAAATWVAEQYDSYLGTTTLFGRGLSVDWPIDDRWRLRAWTFDLNNQSAEIPQSTLQPSRGRDVAWLTYSASTRVRFDAIYRRETDPIEAGRYLDSDAAFVLNEHVILIFTEERHATTSSSGVSLQFGSGDRYDQK